MFDLVNHIIHCNLQGTSEEEGVSLEFFYSIDSECCVASFLN